MAQTFGEKIRALRKEKGLTLDQLADKTESSKSYIWELENKNPPRPSAEKIARIAAELGVTSDYLMDEKDQNKESAEDLAFYRKYRDIDPDTKERVREMLNVMIKKK
jgi:transcriptional regulator with XRE-family HTH domain